MARCGIETIAPNLFKDGRPKSTLYDVLTSTIKYLTRMVLCPRSALPNLVYKSMYPLVSTLSPEKSAHLRGL